jgi:Protein of unknown function (DUF3011)
MKLSRFASPKLLLGCCLLGLTAFAQLAGIGTTADRAMAGGLPQQAVYCGSDDMLRHTCPVDLRGSVVELAKQKSEARCVYGGTWGFDEGGIWVDRGCRADFVIRAAPQAAPVGAVAGTIYCASDDMQRHGCPVDARGGVELVRQHSGSPCIYGRTWGYDDRGVWVDRGCRADFAVAAVSFGGWGDAYNVYCASDDGGRETCPVDARRGVRLIRQRSGSPCILGQTWGYGPRGIWVDRGCRADFRVAGDWNARAGSLIYCASDDMQRHGCEVETRDGVYLVRQRSEADCVFNRTWGFDRRGIWVDRGCRADFEIVDRRNEEWRDWDDRRDRDDRPHYDDRPH